MPNTDFVSNLLDTSSLVKLSSCYDNGGPIGIPSVLCYVTGAGPVMIPMPDDADDHLVWLASSLFKAFQKYGPFVEVGFVGEAFGKDFGSKEKLEEALEAGQAGGLQEQFEMSPLNGISELLVAYALSGSGEASAAIVDFTYNDKGIPLFGEPEYSSGDHEGMIPHVLTTFYKFLQEQGGDEQ